MIGGPWNRGSPVTTHLWTSGSALRVVTTGVRAGMSVGTIIASGDDTLAPFLSFLLWRWLQQHARQACLGVLSLSSSSPQSTPPPKKKSAVRLRDRSCHGQARPQTGPVPRRSRIDAASVMVRDDFLPRRSAGGAAHVVVPCLGGHWWSVVVPTCQRISHAWKWPMLPWIPHCSGRRLHCTQKKKT